MTYRLVIHVSRWEMLVEPQWFDTQEAAEAAAQRLNDAQPRAFGRYLLVERRVMPQFRIDNIIAGGRTQVRMLAA
jgi:hypothetical protein